MSALTRVRPDEFTTAMLATVMLAFLLPCRGTSAGIFGGLAAAAIGLLFFLQGARLSRAAIIAGAMLGGCIWSFLPPPLCCFRSSDSPCGRCLGPCWRRRSISASFFSAPCRRRYRTRSPFGGLSGFGCSRVH
jgi:SBF-like CPA transporter family (DUF4137)